MIRARRMTGWASSDPVWATAETAFDGSNSGASQAVYYFNMNPAGTLGFAIWIQLEGGVNRAYVNKLE